MKNILYTLTILLAIGLSSCKKSNNELSIKQFDDSQIQGYIQANGLNVQQNGIPPMRHDVGDTTGIYYQILSQGTGPVVDYSDKVSYVYTYHTFDNEFSSTDTIVNHTNTFLGHVTPNAIQLALKNILKNKGTKARLLIPSRLAFGMNGYFSGAIHINGNECLDYTINLIDQDYDAAKKINYQAKYDSISIQKYITANGLSGYLPEKNSLNQNTGLYYKVTTPGTGTAIIGQNSVVGVQYTGYLLNGTTFDSATDADATVAATTFYTFNSSIPGFAQGLSHTTAGGTVSFILPSRLAYGDGGSSNSLTGQTIPAFSCLRFDVSVISVTN
jgi:FKBP-type peptidyl-prolyl cis-trans isomerase FkpA